MAGDLVWLHHPAVPRGKSRKLHRPWTGPYRVRTKLIRRGQWCTLTGCSSGTKCTQQPRRKPEEARRPSPPPVGTGLELVEDDSQPITPSGPSNHGRHPPQPSLGTTKASPGHSSTTSITSTEMPTGNPQSHTTVNPLTIS